MPEIDGGLAVAESAESTGALETVETGAETTETGETGSETVAEVDSSTENQGLTQTTPAKSKLSLAEVVKTKADALKAINPELPEAIRKANYELGGLYREFPGGLKEAVAQKQALGEIGGVEGVKEVQAALADYTQLESLFEKGDRGFIDKLADELPASFSQIMPAGLEKWKQHDPEMYNHHQARVMMQTLDSAQISGTLEQIWNAIDGEKQKPLKDAVASLWHKLDGFRKIAETAPERKASPQDEALTKREQEVAQREEKALLAPIANEGKRQIETITEREMAASYKWAETDADVREAVQDRVRSEVINASKKDAAFVREYERLRQRKDAQGLTRHIKNFQDRVTPAIVQRVAKLFAVKPKGAGPAIVKKAVVGTNGNGIVKAEQGWVKWSEGTPPRHNLVDRTKTTEDMILSNPARYILKDGRKVLWG